jgi:hypothetical protein
MIDRTEALFFLNTPRSIATSNIISENKTGSPWIYAELGITSIVKENIPERIKKKKMLLEKSKYFSADGGGVIPIEYDADLSHLTLLNGSDLQSWKQRQTTSEFSLDTLYNLKQIA